MDEKWKLLYPLDEFYAQAGLDLPAVNEVRADEIPEPYRRLLVHEDDMTLTLEAFHKERIHLRVLARRRKGDAYSRQVVLALNGKEQPVEFGAIVINLEHFPPAAREDILKDWRPLGTILAEHNIERVSRPQAFISVTSDDVMKEALKLKGTHELYGRRNKILDGNGNVLAEIVEILPPVKEP